MTTRRQLQAVRAPGAPPPLGWYSHAVIAGSTVYVSAQGPYDPDTGAIVGNDVAAQSERAIDNLEAILMSVGCELDDVVSVTANLASMKLFDGYDAAYRRRFSEPPPARSTVGAELGDVLVVVSCVAMHGAGRDNTVLVDRGP